MVGLLVHLSTLGEYRIGAGWDLVLPTVNALLNFTALVLLIVAVQLVKVGRINAHRNCMFAAFGVSCLFLVFYLLHKSLRYAMTGQADMKFNRPGVIKIIYLLMLFSHLLLAMVVPVLAIWLIRLGLRRDDAKHRRIAKWAYPLWLYVSVTGVLIYLALYHWNPA